MSRLKTFAKYILWIILFYLFTMFLTYVGLNSSYKNMSSNQANLPEGVKVNMAQSTSVNGRIYGEVTSTEENNLNGKYLKVDIFSKNGNFAGSKYLKLDNLVQNEPKKFAVNFTADNINNYTIELLDDIELTREAEKVAIDLFGNKFTKEEIKKYSIIWLVIYGLMFW